MTPEILALGLAALVLGAMAGGLCVVAFEKGGPRAMRTGTLVALVLALGISYGTSLFAAAHDIPALWLSVLPAVSCLAAALLTARETTRRITRMVAMAGAVRDAINTNFDAFDIDDDKVISVVDLEGILAGRAPLPAGVSRELVAHMRDNILKIGHNVGKYQQPAGRTTVTHTVAVISPRDVQGYPDRVTALYPNWAVKSV